ASYTVQEPPDFIVHSITLSPTTPVQGEEVTAKVQVMNQGGSSGDGGYLDVWYDKPSAASVGEDGDDYDNVGTIYAGAIFYYTYTFTASGSGTKTFRAFIDSYNETSEGNENNNQQTKTYTVLPAYLNVSPTSVSVPQGGGSGTFTISANVSWSISDNASWLTVSPTSGSGDKQVTVTASANTGTSQRSATVTVTGNGMTQNITVTQPGRNVYLNVSPTSVSVPQGGGSGTFSISANVSWSISDNADWLTVSPTSGSGDKSVTVTATSANTGTSQRSATVTVTGNGMTQNVTVTQPGVAPYLYVTPTLPAPMPPEGGTITFSVSANVSWNVTVSAGWTVDPPSGSGDGIFKVTASANTGTSARTVTITVSGGGLTRTITVTQPGRGAYLNVSPTSVSVPQGGGSGTFTISANVSWSVSDNADWLTVSPASGSGDKQVTVTASANTGTSDRNATVTVTGDGLSRTVTVSQPGDSLRPVYRFWSPVFSAHFYTISEREKDKVVNTLSQYWDYEGIAYYAYKTQVPGTVPLYRFWSPVFSGHFFTTSERERDKVINTLAQYWDYEGVAYYVYPSQMAGSAPVYRFWSPVFSHHFYTISEREKDKVINNLWQYWDYEGVAFYSIPTEGQRSMGPTAAGAVAHAPEDGGSSGATRSMARPYADVTELTDENASAKALAAVADSALDHAPLPLDVAIPLECPGFTVWAYAREEGTDEWTCILDGVASPGEVLLTGLAPDEACQVEIWAADPEDGEPFLLQAGWIEQTAEVPEDVFDLDSTEAESTPGVGIPLVGIAVPDTCDPMTLRLVSPWEGTLQTAGPAEAGMEVVFELPACNFWFWIGEASGHGTRMQPRWLRYEVVE
ncbi:MAG: hypothetical protein GX174_08585, partial [Lentisphaerae bacterium]|nr:hypothetical protein [Lentisphaerota bacterium]